VKCPFWEICVTPNWYGATHKKFIEEVCSTDEHKKCTHYMGLEAQGYKPNTAEWNCVEAYIEKRRKEY
jgi:hypothetical protein